MSNKLGWKDTRFQAALRADVRQLQGKPPSWEPGSCPTGKSVPSVNVQSSSCHSQLTLFSIRPIYLLRTRVLTTKGQLAFLDQVQPWTAHCEVLIPYFFPCHFPKRPTLLFKTLTP